MMVRSSPPDLRHAIALKMDSHMPSRVGDVEEAMIDIREAARAAAVFALTAGVLLVVVFLSM